MLSTSPFCPPSVTLLVSESRSGRSFALTLSPVAVFLGSAALVAAFTWLTLAVAGRFLGPAEFAVYSGIWSLFYAFAGAAYGYQQELTRFTAQTDGLVTGRPRGYQLGSVSVVCIVVGASTVLILSPLWAPPLATQAPTSLVLILVIGAAIQMTYSTSVGVLAGLGRWSLVAQIILVESLTKLVMTSLIVGRHPASPLMAIVVVFGTATWPLVLLRRDARTGLRDTWRSRMDKPASRISYSVVTSGCTALLIAGFPVLLVITQAGADAASVGSLVGAISLGRAPFLVMAAPATAVLMRGLASSAVRRRDVLTAVGLFIIVVPLGCALAAFFGPTVVRLVFGDGFLVGRGIMVWTVVSAAILGIHMILGTSLIAFGKHPASAAGWMLSVASTLGVLLISDEVEKAASAALVLGPSTGMVVHMCLLARYVRRGRSTPARVSRRESLGITE